MALLAEELVQEWLARQGYFTLRGVKLGVAEIDLLAVRLNGSVPHARHIEVQTSFEPQGYLSQASKALQATGRKATSKKHRTDDELHQGLSEWVHKKFHHPKKQAVRHGLYPGPWTHELILHRLYDERERHWLTQHSIQITPLDTVLAELQHPGPLIPKASGAALAELIHAAKSTT